MTAVNALPPPTRSGRGLVAPDETPASPRTVAAPLRLSTGQTVTVAAAWMVVLTAVQTRHATKTSWHFFAMASRLVFGRAPAREGGGLAVYAVHPKLQFGPFSIVVAQALRIVSFGHGAVAATLLMGAMAPMLLWFVLDARRATTPAHPNLRLAPALAAALVLPAVWTFLSVYSLHLDDALAVTLAVAALWGVAKRSDLVVGISLGLAVASKPWALAFLPLVLALPAGRRRRAGGLAIGIPTLLWSPFLLGAAGTASALSHFTIRNAPDSALRALGVANPVTPSWDRAAQVVIGAAAAAWCACTGRWPAVFMAAMAVRLALDPGTHRYYTAGIVVFVLVWELLSRRWTVPVVSIATALALQLPHDRHWPAAEAGAVRLATFLVVLALALVISGPTPTDADPDEWAPDQSDRDHRALEPATR